MESIWYMTKFFYIDFTKMKEMQRLFCETNNFTVLDPDAVRNLCLPDGLLFRTQKQNLTTAFHPFVITKEDGSRTHGFSLVFFEPLRSSHVTQAILTLQVSPPHPVRSVSMAITINVLYLICRPCISQNYPQPKTITANGPLKVAKCDLPKVA